MSEKTTTLSRDPVCRTKIEQDHAGDCAICGMSVGPAAPSRDAPPDPDLVEFRRRLAVGAPLAIAVVALEMGTHLGLPVAAWLGADVARALQFALTAPIVFWVARPFFERGWASLRKRWNMWTLIALGAGAAFAFSATSVLAPDLFPPSLKDAAGRPPIYFEAAAAILVLALLGQVLELSARERVGDAIRSLLRLAPETARRIAADGSESDAPIDAIAPGDRLRIRPGEAVPVDGAVEEGRSAVDESLLTGEPSPVPKAPGDPVIAGAVNGSGGFVMRAEKVGAETRLARIVDLVAAAQRSRAPIQAVADRAAGWFTPAVVGVAGLAFAAWLLFGPAPALPFAFVAAISVLIIACPCALGLATPMSIQVAAGRGAREGVLIRDAQALEQLAEVDVVVLDKTGTLTEGRPRVVRVAPRSGWSEAEALSFAAALERGSEHPLAAAVLDHAAAIDAPRREAEAFDAVPGRGVQGRVDGRAAALGGPALMASLGVDLGGDLALRGPPAAAEATSIFLHIDGAVVCRLDLQDAVKPEAADALAALRAAGLRLVMATGDGHGPAARVAATLGIEEVHAAQSPEDKAALIAGLRESGAKVAMAGDGVNDAPALAAADVGVAMGAGADVAIESAGITLLKDDLDALVRARRLAQATAANIRQNLGFAFLYNSAGVPLAAGALYPVFGILLSPMFAAAAMSLSSLCVVANALRLRHVAL